MNPWPEQQADPNQGGADQQNRSWFRRCRSAADGWDYQECLFKLAASGVIGVHDQPIHRGRAAVWLEEARILVAARRELGPNIVLDRVVSSLVLADVVQHQVSRYVFEESRQIEDRKSTRLNSSHLG